DQRREEPKAQEPHPRFRAHRQEAPKSAGRQLSPRDGKTRGATARPERVPHRLPTTSTYWKKLSWITCRYIGCPEVAKSMIVKIFAPPLPLLKPDFEAAFQAVSGIRIV